MFKARFQTQIRLQCNSIFSFIPIFSKTLILKNIQKTQEFFCNLDTWLLNAIGSTFCCRTKLKRLKRFSYNFFYGQVVKTLFLKSGLKLLPPTVIGGRGLIEKYLIKVIGN